jgi:Tol biopolymer transport system component
MTGVDGSGLRQVTNGESGKAGDWDPSWSPDRESLAFGTLGFGASWDNSPSQAFIRVLDLKTNRVSILPGSEGMWSPHWSPDGSVIAGLSAGLARLMLYDLRTRKQTSLSINTADPRTGAGTANF